VAGSRSASVVLATVVVALVASAWGSQGATITGQVVDAATGRPIAGASVTSDGDVVQSDARGEFRLKAGDLFRYRAPGYRRRDIPGAALTPVVALEPFSPRALYLSVFGVGNRRLRESALELIGQTELNAVVIDVKGDSGFIAYRSTVALAARIGAQNVIAIEDPAALIAPAAERNLHHRPHRRVQG